MIAHLNGQVAEKTATSVILDVGGVGYEVQLSAGDLQAAPLGETLKLYTYDHLRENSHELFGFTQLVAKRLFELLISVPGVGPKMALAILSLGEAESIRSAIALSDSAFVQRASGVGKRIAGRIVLDLKDKVGAPGTALTPNSPVAGVPGDDALDALLALGYSLQQANQALSQVDASQNVQERVKQALKVIDV